jgi:hypothetical protein
MSAPQHTYNYSCSAHRPPTRSYAVPSEKKKSVGTKVLYRVIAFLVVTIVAIGIFYCSLVFSADRLSRDQQAKVEKAIQLLETRGFADEVFYLRRLAVFRANDNWLNASVEKENAYAATNYPFEIVTLYSQFFTEPVDDVERAVVLLHEAKHLQGKDEKDAYEFVWRNRKKLGWTDANYRGTEVHNQVRDHTRQYVPILFVCDFHVSGDCTE